MATENIAPGGEAGTAAGASATAAAVAANPLNLQRILKTVDPFSAAGLGLASTLQPMRTSAVTHIFTGIEQIRANLNNIVTLLAAPQIPTPLIGVLQLPDGSNAASLQIQFNPQSAGGTSAPVTTISADDGSFNLAVPPGLSMPANGVQLTVHGANGNAQAIIASTQVAANGLVGGIKLGQALAPLPVSILQSLSNITAGSTGAAPAASGKPPQLPSIGLGESGSICGAEYGGSQSIDTFPYGVFYRLVAPQLSIVQEVTQVATGDNGAFFPLPIYNTGATPANITPIYTDRVPVEQPLSVDGFRDQVMGLDTSGVFTADETVAMAATLGLGYVLWMSQQWTYQGVALGNLVYSLPLSPGEQQQVAVFERVDTAAVSETETLTEAQQQQQSALADTSTQATFDSAFNEAASGGSAFQTQSDTSSWGASILIASGGGGSSSSSGSSSSWLQGQRDLAEQAAQSTHSAAENQASARRTAARTGMRLATASEQESITTKTITNHNHAHALTMQYWEVQRMYDVTTAIDGLTLACLAPLQLVRFMPPGQPLTISNPATLGTRALVLARYAAIVKHTDVLEIALPRSYQKGLSLLRQFVSDPSAQIEPFGGNAEDVINFTVSGTFVPCEDITISAVTDRNTRIGPVHMAPPPNFAIAPNTYTSQDDLLASLSAARLTPTPFTGSLALPPTLNRSNVIGFEISRSFRQVDYTLASESLIALQSLNQLFGGSGNSWISQAIQSQLADAANASRVTVHITPSQLETAIGGPMLLNFSAKIEEFDANGNPQPASKGETYANDSLYGVVLPAQPYPVPALQLAPVLRYNELLTIEAMAQHVLRNTTRYSKAVWSSLTAEERAILLDQYTIGVPPGGVTDASQTVPLLDCVENRVLGFFGNSMILPFTIPQSVAEQLKIDPVQVQQSLLAYQQTSFQPPRSTIALPTQGMLGEAVLGRCASAEKIDLTRFWNWQDSPSDSAPTISPVTLPTTTPSIAAGLTAPNSLGQLPSLINNVLTAPTPSSSLAQALGQDAASQQDFSTSLTGAAQLASLITNAQNVSNSARADALKTTKDLQSQAMATVGNIVGGVFAGNPTAGSSAASAVNGSGGASTATPKTGTTGTSGTGSGTSGAGSGAATGSGATGSTSPPAGSGTSGASALGTAGSLLGG